jgi:hypothetical protein
LSGARPTKIDTGTRRTSRPDQPVRLQQSASESNGLLACAARDQRPGIAADSAIGALAPTGRRQRRQRRRQAGLAAGLVEDQRVGQAVVFQHVNRAAILEAGRIFRLDLQRSTARRSAEQGQLASDGVRRRVPAPPAAAPGRPEGVSGAAGNGRGSVSHRRHYGPAAGTAALAGAMPCSTGRSTVASARSETRAASCRNASGYQCPSRRAAAPWSGSHRPADIRCAPLPRRPSADQTSAQIGEGLVQG